MATIERKKILTEMQRYRRLPFSEYIDNELHGITKEGEKTFVAKGIYGYADLLRLKIDKDSSLQVMSAPFCNKIYTLNLPILTGYDYLLTTSIALRVAEKIFNTRINKIYSNEIRSSFITIVRNLSKEEIYDIFGNPNIKSDSVFEDKQDETWVLDNFDNYVCTLTLEYNPIEFKRVIIKTHDMPSVIYRYDPFSDRHIQSYVAAMEKIFNGIKSNRAIDQLKYTPGLYKLIP